MAEIRGMEASPMPRETTSKQTQAFLRLEQSKAKAKPCPLCLQLNKPDTKHTYIKKFNQWKVLGSLEWPSNRLLSCPSFLQLNPTDRRDTLVDLGGCVQCAVFLHKQDDCMFKPPKCKEKDFDGTICGARHLTELHSCDHSIMLALSISSAQPAVEAATTSRPLCTFMEISALLAIVRVPAGTGKEDILLLCDEGAQVSLVRHSTAQRLGAGPGTLWILSIQVMGEEFRNLPT